MPICVALGMPTWTGADDNLDVLSTIQKILDEKDSFLSPFWH